ncbi:hypothetical protein [Streptomyces sp. NRRL S-118]|uniref:hypothetical protein n=1 Tax=Streptomyces sp. NRRL S-118 TaxID=1463881 RepID=UPI001F394F27|nr:hypothetical protein [Streptomyces sp. NRRL S-118]
MIPSAREAWHRVHGEAGAVGRSVRSALTGPGPERDLAVQSLKAAGAAILAWAVAGWWWQAPLALMAPWTAVALVQSTVYRSVRTGVQQVVLIAAGTVLAAAAAGLTGNTMAAMSCPSPSCSATGPASATRAPTPPPRRSSCWCTARTPASTSCTGCWRRSSAR